MKWVSSLSYLPIRYGIPLAEVADQTQRVIFPNNLNGNKLRLRFSNRYGTKPLVLEKVTVGVEQNGKITHIRTVSSYGEAAVRLAPFEERWSDELDYPVAAGDKIAVSAYVRHPQTIESICIFWSGDGALVRLSTSGDYTDGGDFAACPAEQVYPFVAQDMNKGMVFYGFSGLQVYTDDAVKVTAAFGDSITHMSYVTNAILKRLCKEAPGRAALLNCGIGGNRLLHNATSVDFIPGNAVCFGNAGIMRFEQDVFSTDAVDTVLVLEGINDIMHPIQFCHQEEQVTAAELADGYQRLIRIAHQHGARIFGATITPCGNQEYPAEWLPQFEEIRLEVNRRIRDGIGFDGYFDYDAAVRDAQKPGFMKADCHIGDGLHPNARGGTRMAGSVDLTQLLGGSAYANFQN